MATILVVDDDPMVLRLVGIILKREGYEVLLASSATEAFDEVERHTGHIDLLITDLLMGSSDGGSLAEAMRARIADLHILYMSGMPRGVLAEHGIDLAASYVQKPFTALSLLRAILGAMNGTNSHSTGGSCR